MTKSFKIIALTALLTLNCPARAWAEQQTDSSRIEQFSSRVAPYAVRIGTSVVLNAALTEVLKNSIHELRPDRHDNNSWPSRHTSWITTAGAIVSNELWQKSPWWVVGSHAVVNIVGMQRTMSSAHYPKDVLGGMAVGIVSTELGYLLGRALYPNATHKPVEAPIYEFMPTLDVETDALFPLCGGTRIARGHTSMSASVRASLPIGDLWGITVRAGASSIPMYLRENGAYQSMIDAAGLSLGAMLASPIGNSRWGLEGRLMPGVTYNFHGQGLSYSRLAFTIDAQCSAVAMITNSLGLGINVDYYFRALRRNIHALGVGGFTRVVF